MNGNVVTINGRDYISPNGYPKFGFWLDEETKKYSIANVETKEATEPFVDEVTYSELPLETWTANYVVVRIENMYYLADNNGNCYIESSEPYIICRNVFVKDTHFVITKDLQKERICMKNGFRASVDIEDHGGYRFALANLDGKRNIINAHGQTIDNILEIHNLGTISNWYIIAEMFLKSGAREDCYIFFNKNFEMTYTSICSPELYGKKSGTYKLYYEYFSTYFSKRVEIYLYNKLEVVICDGKTYFFKENGEIEEIDMVITIPKELNKLIVYRQDDEVITRNFKGEVIAVDKLSPKELYNFILSERLLSK